MTPIHKRDLPGHGQVTASDRHIKNGSPLFVIKVSEKRFLSDKIVRHYHYKKNYSNYLHSYELL